MCVCIAFVAIHSYYQQQQQQLGKPGESRVTSPQHDKENIIGTSSSWRRSSGSRSIFGCVELLAETSCGRQSHLTPVLPPYLVKQSSHYSHVTTSPAAMFAAVTSSPVAAQTPVSPVYVYTIYRTQRNFYLTGKKYGL